MLMHRGENALFYGLYVFFQMLANCVFPVGQRTDGNQTAT